MTKTLPPSKFESSMIESFEASIRALGENQARLSHLLDLAPPPYVLPHVAADRAATACYLAGE